MNSFFDTTYYLNINTDVMQTKYCFSTAEIGDLTNRFKEEVTPTQFMESHRLIARRYARPYGSSCAFI